MSNPVQEREANIFAMCLLMPEQLVRDEVDKMKRAKATFDLVEGSDVLALAKIFQVSPTMMAIRLADIYKLS